MFVLNANEPKELAHYLLQKKWLNADEEILSLVKPGEGNMNYVLRVTTNLRTFIVKQSRAYVEKYPQIAAPEKRVITEAAFYQKIANEKSIQDFMPSLLALDAENNLLLMEDLGNSYDYSFLYNSENQLSDDEVKVLVTYLNNLHTSFEKVILDEEFANLALRKLNFEHIFIYPFLEENGFDLNSIQQGLQELAMPFKKDIELKAKIESLSSVYMATGNSLLHGDYYPGSWIKSSNGIKIIDPEFCFYGPKEFDLGVLIAHLYLTNQNQNSIDSVSVNYQGYSKLNIELLNGFIGVEILRRIIGLAQLPLTADLTSKNKLMQFARTLILN